MTLSTNFDGRNYVETYRQGRLVYVRNFKCASTFFSNVFESAGWNRILYSNIDWDQDHVFSHIREPIYRRSLGLVEWATACGLLEELVNDPRISQLLRTAPGLSDYMPYLDYFGSTAWKIDWIPLTGTVEQNIQITKKLLESHGVIIDDQQWIQPSNPSDPLQKQATQQLHQLLEYAMITDIEHLFTDNEYLHQYVRNAVLRHFYNSVRDATWPICPDIKDFYTLPLFIRKELAEVHCNNRVKISQDLTTVKIIQQLDSTEALPYKRRYGIDTFQALGPVLQDIELWTKILDRFNSNGNTWSEISW